MAKVTKNVIQRDPVVTFTLELNVAEAQVLWDITRNIGGLGKRRALVSAIGEAIEAQADGFLKESNSCGPYFANDLKGIWNIG